MSDPNSLIVPAQIFGCLALSVLTTLIPLEIISRLDKSPRSSADQFSEDMFKIVMPTAMVIVSVIGLTIALEAGTTLAMVLALAFAALIGPISLASIAAIERFCQTASKLLEPRAAKQAP